MCVCVCVFEGVVGLGGGGAAEGGQHTSQPILTPNQSDHDRQGMALHIVPAKTVPQVEDPTSTF